MTATPDDSTAVQRDAALDLQALRCAVQAEYRQVAIDPHAGYHFHTGRALADIVGYDPAWLEAVPEGVLASFAGTGNPFAAGLPRPGEHVVDLGCGAGMDSFIAAHHVGIGGRVVGVDMTHAMLEKAWFARLERGLSQLSFVHGFLEELPLEDASADLIISNGAINLCPDKPAVFREIARVLRPGGRLQIADITVERAVPRAAKEKIHLWTG